MNTEDVDSRISRHLQALASATGYGVSADGILSENHPPYLIGRGGHLAGFMDTLLHTTNATIATYVQAYANVQASTSQSQTPLTSR